MDRSLIRMLFLLLVAGWVPGSASGGAPEGTDPLLDCFCTCACADVGWSCGEAVTCVYFPFVFTASPACSDPDLGECVCRGFGCGRAEIAGEGACVEECRAQNGAPTTTPSPAATPTVAAGAREVNFYRRGDANCSVTKTAADVIAALHGLGGETLCGNDDCDRNGEMDGADVDCGARCVFGRCPVPPNAPAVSEVLAHTSPAVAPFSTIRIVGTGFSSEDRLKSVTIGGRQAPVVDPVEPAELFVVVPDIAPGTADVVLFDGDLDGAPFSIQVAPPQRLGPEDSFDDFIDLIDDVVTALIDLDLSDVPADDAAIFRRQLNAFRADLPDFVEAMFAAAESPSALRSRLDFVVDVSGVPEQLRESISELHSLSLAAQRRGPAGVVARETVKAVARNLGSAARTVIAAAPEAAATVSLGTQLVIAAGVVVATVAVFGATEAVFADTPFIAEVSDGAILRNGERFTIIGRGFGSVPPYPSLVIQTRSGDIALETSKAGEIDPERQFLEFALPFGAGICGNDMRMYLTRRLLLIPKSSAPVPFAVKPTLVDVNTSQAGLGERFSMTTRGAVGCTERDQTFVRLQRVSSGTPVTRETSMSELGETDVQMSAPSGMVPDSYSISVVVQGIASDEAESVILETDLKGLRIECGIAEVSNVGLGESVRCKALPLPATAKLPAEPGSGVYDWTFSDPGIVVLTATDGNEATIEGVKPGEVTPHVILYSDDDAFIARSGSGGARIAVADLRGPTISKLERLSPEVVLPGGAIRVRVEAVDDLKVARIFLHAMGDAVDPVFRDQEASCGPLVPETCSAQFELELRGSGFSDREVVLVATAVDSSGNVSADSAPLRFTIEVAEIGGTIRSAQDGAPIAGADVRLLNDRRHFLDGVKSESDGRFTIDDPGEAAILSVAKSGFRPAEQSLSEPEQRPRGAAPLDLNIALVPITGETGRLYGETRTRTSLGTPLAGVTVTAFDRDGIVAGLDFSDGDGAYEIAGLPLGDYVVTGAAFGKATVSGHVRVQESENLIRLPLVEVNQACSSALNAFELVYGSREAGVSSFGLASIEEPISVGKQDPSAAILCVSGSPAAPVFDWDPQLESVFRLVVREEANGPVIFQLRAKPAMRLEPPITFGDYSKGIAEDPQPPGTIVPGMLYTLTTIRQSGILLLEFRSR